MEFNLSNGISANEIGQPIVSQELLLIFQMMNFAVVGQSVALFGCITNIINMIIFRKIGFKETINLSLFALAISDFGACLMVMFFNLSMTPGFNELEVSFYPSEVLYVVPGLTKYIISKITVIITAFITFERCLCVAMPLKVKTYITPGRVKTFLVSTYFILIASYCIPMYYANQLGLRFDPRRNQSILGIAFVYNSEEVENAVFMVFNAFCSYIAFIFIVVCTAILVITLSKKAQWRQTVTTVSTSNLSSKESKAAKMVVFIALLCIACFGPNLVLCVMMLLDPEFSVTGLKSNLFMAYLSFSLFIESINSGMNIFIYYRNSSVYHKMFHKLLFRLRNGAEKVSK